MACSTFRWASLSAYCVLKASPWARAIAPTVGRGGPCPALDRGTSWQSTDYPRAAPFFVPSKSSGLFVEPMTFALTWL